MEINVIIDQAQQEKITKLLEELPVELQKNVIRRATRAAMAPVRKTIKGLINVNDGVLMKSIKIRQKRYPRSGVIYTMVVADAPHAYLVEFGHRLVAGRTVLDSGNDRIYRVKGRKGKLLGFVPPHPFMRPGMEANLTKVLDIYRNKLIDGMMKEIAKFK